MLLHVQKLNKHFGGIAAVKNCSFTIDQGTITGLIGPNGAGKTTVFNLITGFYKADSGKILFKNNDITNKRPDKIANLGIATTFQLPHLFANMTVLENVMLGRKHQLGEGIIATFLPFLHRTEERENYKDSMKLLQLVHMDAFSHKKALHLSYGQAKLVEIARILATDAELLLLDEPLAGLNPAMVKLMYSVLNNLRSIGKTILLIEHDMKTIHALCEKVIVLDYGTEIAVGTPQEIKKDKKVIEAYIGGIE